MDDDSKFTSSRGVAFLMGGTALLGVAVFGWSRSGDRPDPAALAAQEHPAEPQVPLEKMIRAAQAAAARADGDTGEGPLLVPDEPDRNADSFDPDARQDSPDAPEDLPLLQDDNREAPQSDDY